MCSNPLKDIEDLGYWHGEYYAEHFPICSCNKCAAPCLKIPGIYDPTHLHQMLQTGEMTIDNMLDTCLLDYYTNTRPEDVIIYIRPATINETPGKNASFMPKVGACVHLKSNGCQLPRNQMPVECISSYGCRTTNKLLYGKGKGVETWKGVKGMQLVKLFTAFAKKRGATDVGYEDLIARLYYEESNAMSLMLDPDNLQDIINIMDKQLGIKL